MTDKTSEIENQIAQRIIWDALGAGYVISVMDGEDIPLRHSADEAVILAALRSTDEDYLFFYRADDTKNRVGWVRLIWGNGIDLISDATSNPATDAILEGAAKLAGELEAA